MKQQAVDSQQPPDSGEDGARLSDMAERPSSIATTEPSSREDSQGASPQESKEHSPENSVSTSRRESEEAKQEVMSFDPEASFSALPKASLAKHILNGVHGEGDNRQPLVPYGVFSYLQTNFTGVIENLKQKMRVPQIKANMKVK
ncbi:MAG: hypothetical protein K0U12_03790, partial [Gammaproteobacteria bacterium]|nr:hypothetical protein [Gammaproteobacteria bacterium]